MQTFPVSFSRTPVTVLILIVVPLVAAALFITPLIIYPQSPDWLVIPTIVVMMIVAIGSLRFIIKKYGSVNAEVDLDEAGIHVRLVQRSLLYPRREYHSDWEGLENVSTNIDPQHSRRYYLISFRQPAVTISLMPSDITLADQETPFGEALLDNVARYNSTHTIASESRIRQQGFYDTWWAQGLTVFAYLMIASTLIMRVVAPERVSIWKLVQVLCVGTLWLSAYHINRRRKP